jgi:hypothetical protein
MTYHSLAIYYDNQLAENEQKRVSLENRFANLLDSHRSEKMNDGTARASFLEEGCAPTFQFLSHGVACGHIAHALSYHAALGLLGVACGHIAHALSYHAACSLVPCRLRAPSVSPAGTSRMLSRTMPHALSYHAAFGLLESPVGHITHDLSHHAAWWATSRMLCRDFLHISVQIRVRAPSSGASRRTLGRRPREEHC